MIGFLQGSLFVKKVDSVIVLAAGVGYQLECPASTLWTLPREGERAALYVSTYVREDAIRLFGFASELDKQVFETLIGVASVGPKLALSLLGPFTGVDLVHALYLKETEKLLAVPGVGERKLEKLFVEMGPKIERLWAIANSFISNGPTPTPQKVSQALFDDGGEEQPDQVDTQKIMGIREDLKRDQAERFRKSELIQDLESALTNIGHRDKFIKPCLDWVQAEWAAGRLESSLEDSLRAILQKQSARLVSSENPPKLQSVQDSKPSQTLKGTDSRHTDGAALES